MSTTEEQEFADYMVERENKKPAERRVLFRTYAATAEVKGRTVDVRLVPFGEVARVADPPLFEPYDEEWMPGCFDHQVNAANRVHANYEHLEGPANIVGHGVSLRSEPDGYHVTTVIHDTNAGDATLAMLRADPPALPQVSLEARPVRNVRSQTGVIQRVKANLRGFAFCREGAFAGAQVLAVRNDDDEPELTVDAVDTALLPVDLDPELVERCRRLGIALPQRYQAHPDETGTPDDSGTPAGGTRHDGENPEVEESQHGNTD